MDASISVMEGTSNYDILFHLKTGIESSTLAGDTQFSPRRHPDWLRVREISGRVVLDVLPNFDPFTADIALAGREFIHPGIPPSIIVNLSMLKVINSSFLAHLIALRKYVLRASGRIVLCGVNSRIRELLQRTRLDMLFTFAERPQDALQMS